MRGLISPLFLFSNNTSVRTYIVLLSIKSVFYIFLVDKLNLSTQLHKQVQLAYENVFFWESK